MFSITEKAIDTGSLREGMLNAHSGGFCCFEGWVRNHHDGKRVKSLEYTAYRVLAEKEGSRIVKKAKEQFAIDAAVCEHRIGHLSIGEMAVYVAVAAAHRDAAFLACRFIIDEVKKSVPIWKKEYYLDGSSDFPHCLACQV